MSKYTKVTIAVGVALGLTLLVWAVVLTIFCTLLGISTIGQAAISFAAVLSFVLCGAYSDYSDWLEEQFEGVIK